MRSYAVAGVALLAAFAVAAYSGSSAPVNVKGSVGGPATVEGVVSDVHVAARSGVTFIDMGGRYPVNAFVAVIWPEDTGKFPNVGALYGQKVKITGVLKLYRGKPEIILKDASQLKPD